MSSISSNLTTIKPPDQDMENMPKTEKAQVRMPKRAGQKLEWLDVLFSDETLSPTAKNVAWRLVRHDNDDTGRCFPEQATLAAGIGLSVRVVNKAIRELKESGWIEVEKRNRRTFYVLVLDRAEGVEAGETRRMQRVTHVGSGVADTSDAACETRRIRRTVTPKGTPKGTPHSTPSPAEAASAPVATMPAIVPSSPPDQPEITTSAPANDDAPEEMEDFGGLKVPRSLVEQWEKNWPDLNVRGQLCGHASWYAKDKPNHVRVGLLAGRLSKLDAEERKDRVTRSENRQADRDAGIRKDYHGRVTGAPHTSRFQFSSGYSKAPVAPDWAHVGPGYTLTPEHMGRITTRWPTLDARAEIAAFDRDHADPKQDPQHNWDLLFAFLDRRSTEAKAA